MAAVWLFVYIFIKSKAAPLGCQCPLESYNKNKHPILKQSYLKTKERNK